MKIRTALSLLTMLVGMHCHATLPGNASDREIKVDLIETGATMSEQTLNCGLISPKEVQKARDLQRKNFPAQLGFSTAEYDRIYTQALLGFRQKWSAMSAQAREQTCKQTHMLNKD